ncbi:MAG: hypothetical protein ACXWKN_07910 [Phenylobacterium sp.]
MNFKLQLMLGSALFAGAFSTAAMAQTKSAITAAAATTNTIEELVVTAEKREQNL